MADDGLIPMDELRAVVANPPHRVQTVMRTGRIGVGAGEEDQWSLTTERMHSEGQGRGPGGSTIAMDPDDVMALFHMGKLTLADDPHKKPEVEAFLKKHKLTRQMLQPRSDMRPAEE